MGKISRISCLAALVVGLAGVTHAQVGSTFQQGRTRLSLTGGYGVVNDRSYGVLGAGAGYYLFEGFEVGVDGEAWLGSRPHIYTVSPEARYVVNEFESMKPYVGAFYKRTFYDSLENTNSFGGRAGVISPLSEHVYLSAGLVFEHINQCDKTLYDSCDLVYPEVGFSLSY